MYQEGSIIEVNELNSNSISSRDKLLQENIRLATLHNLNMLRGSFSYDMCTKIGRVLSFSDLLSLFSTCKYFYNTNILKKCFEEHLNFGLKNPLGISFVSNFTLPSDSIQENIGVFVQKRIKDLMEFGKSDEDKQNIRRWLLITEESFNMNSNLFLQKSVTINIDVKLWDVPNKINACQFFAYIGSVKLLEMLKDMVFGRGESKLFYEVLVDEHAFIRAAVNNHIEILKLLWGFAGNKNDLKLRLLSFDSYRAFILAAKNDCVKALELLWSFIGQQQGLRQQLLDIEGVSSYKEAFKEAIIGGRVNAARQLLLFANMNKTLILKLLRIDNYTLFNSAASFKSVNGLSLLWELADNYKGLRFELLTQNNYTVFCEAIDSWTFYIDALKLLWEFASGYEGVGEKFLTVSDCQAFRKAIKLENLVALNLLWDFSDEHVGLRQAISTEIAPIQTAFFRRKREVPEEKVMPTWLRPPSPR